MKLTKEDLDDIKKAKKEDKWKTIKGHLFDKMGFSFETEELVEIIESIIIKTKK